MEQPLDEQYARIEAIVSELLDLTHETRKLRLDQLAAEEPDVADRVQALLASDAQLDTRDFMSEPVAHEWSAAALESARPVGDGGTAQPEAIGHYRIVRHLGTGGMGTVYLAEQTEPVERQVALKVTHGFQSPRERERFALEAQALARMRHPAVASMYESGSTDDGTPFVVMELVEDAKTIVEWCDQAKANLRQRLELFSQVCAGIAHAHEQGILHRDLKPANVLVTEVDGRPAVKVIDFGIARAFGGDASTQITRGSIAGSPAYMSPEAVGAADRGHLDTRSDVYSLGLILCELIAGELPFPPRRLAKCDDRAATP